jgi:hypothetical protein
MSAKKLFESLAEAFPALKDFKSDLVNEGVHQVGAGAHELAAALFNGSGFVMYPRQTGHDDQNHGVNGPDVQAPETPQVESGNEMEHGGRSR